MPDPTIPARALDMTTAPGGDINFDDLFPIEGEEPIQPPQAAAPGTATPPVEPQAPPAAPEPERFYLQTPTGTVYKTQEEAVRGLAHKDEVIERLRQDAISRTGIDPITGKPAYPVVAQPQVANYVQDGKAYYRDSAAAIAKGDEEAWARVQQKFVSDVLSPYAPVLTNVARQQAVQQVGTKLEGFNAFYGSKDYSEALDAAPPLKQAIEIAESDPNQAAQLPSLYELAFYVGAGRKVPELVKQAASHQPPVQPPSPARTVAPSSLTPPASGAQPNLRTPEGRKALIAQFESSGGLDRQF